jgi:hypothetical protein
VSATVARLTEASAKKTWVSLAGVIQVVIQPMSAKDSAFTDGNISDSFVGYIELGDSVLQGDRITAEGIVYDVRSVQIRAYGGGAHKKLFLEKTTIQ